jgi:transcriptional regulator GlxA family with amidase domain
MTTASTRSASRTGHAARRVALVALPDAGFAMLAGIYDVMNAHTLMGLPNATTRAPFHVENVGESAGPMQLVSGVPVEVRRAIDSIESSDIRTGRLFALQWHHNGPAPYITFKRRFTAATGLVPIAYVQRLRIEDAKLAQP